MVDLDLAALVGGKPRLFKRKPIGVGLPDYRHEHDVGRYRLGLAACGGHHGHGCALALRIPLGDLGGGAEVHALLLRSEEITCELPSLMRHSYAVLCLEKN